jgi:NADP-dependent 3-hydroxy acid dehydrogenase YdfG
LNARVRPPTVRYIVNVSSGSGHRVDPTAALYRATKLGVAALSEGLRQASHDIRVTVVSPGFTRSELTDRGGSPGAQAAARAAAEQLAIPASAIAAADQAGLNADRPGWAAGTSPPDPGPPVTRRMPTRS